ncbi:hypothetical protein FSARC_13619 [Fusarium sarcochroum]|uniref:Heterokaryon incompatibility domain-containing protein n=1 Tax=Fusarium sarcochroum TaxID=1208366 RepID=A0A8H4T0A0_9HYPO|nr:hypothetical protein FSARC_13619 [Fusarium sarcochroum]
MRLLNTHKLRLESFNGAEIDIPLYAILSHTWGDDEITFQDITQQPFDQLRRHKSFYKVQESCAQARKDGFDYVWIDTCCIDKTSSAELSEAINSMFKWYQQADLCYVFLSDFDSGSSYQPVATLQGKEVHLEASDTSFFTSRWFTRGWTLQELIAPRNVNFFDERWIKFGSRDGSLLDRISQRTGIWPQLFAEPRCSCPKGYPAPPVRDGVCMDCRKLDALPQTLDSFAVSIKMSWASSRVTTRKEDAAYCLLGLFNLNMPMLYGEGDKAFLRLQEAIVRQSKDQSLLLWRAGACDLPQERAPGCLAPSSGLFKEPVRILGRRVFNNVDRRYETDFLGTMAPMELTDTALRTNLWICPCTVGAYDPQIDGYIDRKLWLGILDLAHDYDYLVRPALLLEHMAAVDLYRRVYHQLIIPVDPRQSHGTLQVSVDVDRQGAILEGGSALSDLSTIVITRSLDEASKKDVGILLQQSPINAVSTNPSLEEGPETGPVYFVVTARKPKCTIDSGGSHPPISRYNTRATQIPSPWAFKKCQHPGTDRYFGGIHFVNFAVDSARSAFLLSAHQSVVSRGYVAITWGVHRKLATGGEEPSPWKLWCRVFNMHAFIKSARTSPEDLQPSQLYLECEALSPGEIQHRMENQRRRLCLGGYERFWIQQESGPKVLFPDSYEGDWSEDSLVDIMGEPTMDTRLTARVAMTQGLGRTLFEVQVSIDQVVKQKK